MAITDAQRAKALQFAGDEGIERGANAGEWFAQDAFGGRSRAGAIHAGIILRGIEDIDSRVMDSFPAPNLSGEWADGLTAPELVSYAMDAAGVDEEAEAEAVNDLFADICDEYENAFSDAVVDKITDLAQSTLGIVA